MKRREMLGAAAIAIGSAVTPGTTDTTPTNDGDAILTATNTGVPTRHRTIRGTAPQATLKKTATWSDPWRDHTEITTRE